jgi:integration host factor subunit alpha
VAGKNVTRTDLSEAVYQKMGLSRLEATGLAVGETVKLSGFGLFQIRDKGQRVGRNPKAGVEVPIAPHRVVTFRPSHLLKAHVKGKASKTDD